MEALTELNFTDLLQYPLLVVTLIAFKFWDRYRDSQTGLLEMWIADRDKMVSEFRKAEAEQRQIYQQALDSLISLHSQQVSHHQVVEDKLLSTIVKIAELNVTGK